MKKEFNKLNIYEPKQQIGKEYKKCEFSVSKVIIETNDISIILEQGSFKTNNKEKDVEE